jgi:hypothetical protein
MTTNLEDNQMTATTTAAAAANSELIPSVIDRWRATREHSAAEHAAYTILRGHHLALKKELDDPQLIEHLQRKLARAFTPCKGDDQGMKTLKDTLYYLARYSYAMGEALFTEEERETVKEWSLILHDELRTSAGLAKFRSFVVPTPPPRPKKPYVPA